LHWQSLLDRAPSAENAAAALTALRGDWGLVPLVLVFAVVTTLGGVVVYLSTDRR
jgi:hypothetical protein